MGEIQDIKITYKDGTEKTITRGVCFSVYEEGENVKVSCDGSAGGEEDVAAVLAIVSSIARELGYDGLSERAEECND